MYVAVDQVDLSTFLVSGTLGHTISFTGWRWELHTHTPSDRNGGSARLYRLRLHPDYQKVIFIKRSLSPKPGPVAEVLLEPLPDIFQVILQFHRDNDLISRQIYVN